RGTIVPLLVLFHHQPVFALPNGQCANNSWLDLLWRDAHHKQLSGSVAFTTILLQHGPGWKATFAAADVALRQYQKLRVWPFQQLRQHAVDRCLDWILKHQEADGDWAGIFPPMLNGVLALSAHGYRTDSEPLRLGLEAIERFVLQDSAGIRIEACQSPVWDTTLMMIGLLDSGTAAERLKATRQWITRLQILEDHGDWKIYNPRGKPGGWSFEYANTWYPDVDDTAAVVTAFVKHEPASARSSVVRRALDWVVSMQNEDGGWAAFDKANDKLFLNEIPFADMGSLCDPSTPDIAGRVLEALGLVSEPRYEQACARGIAYLREAQEPEGCWFGRWGVNYVYGTSNVLCALRHHDLCPAEPMIARALSWLLSVQNADGGWGESVASYADRSFMGRGPSTASQTAWALMALLAFLPAQHRSVQRGVEWLLARQTDEGSWAEQQFTGTGFPKHFYLRYHMYRHYFPLMALGRYLHATQVS
ncbi:MAG TPA: squalene--hopene cyclase, partial [Polyangiaceae bacterium]